MDEKWSFVGEKDPLDIESDHKGENWDHVAMDAENKLILAVIPGKRTKENCEELVAEVYERTNGNSDVLITTDGYTPYKDSIEKAYEKKVEVKPTGKPGRPLGAKGYIPKDLVYATVIKEKENGRVVNIKKTLVFGTQELLEKKLKNSSVSVTVNTSIVERYNGTDRGKNSRKTRKAYTFSKDWSAHNMSTYFTNYSYNFCRVVRTIGCTPAMSAKLTDHIWGISEWCNFRVLAA